VKNEYFDDGILQVLNSNWLIFELESSASSSSYFLNEIAVVSALKNALVGSLK
jgi:hypothetical protein